MISEDPISITQAFNDCINNQDIEGLSDLMAESHTFIDRAGESHGPKSQMVEGWKHFFQMFPDYRNTFEKAQTAGNQVFIQGFAYWSEEEPYDPVIWTAILQDNLVSEWRIYEDTPENRKKFKLI
ncbi:nuclear transport factor 2 family protein [Bacteroidota bacterium]